MIISFCILYPKTLRGYRLHIEIALHLQSNARHLTIIRARTGNAEYLSD